MLGMVMRSDPKLVEKLNITDKQKEELREIVTKASEEIRKSPEGADRLKKIQELGKQTNEKIEKLLTEDQKKTLKELGGAEFKGEITVPNLRPSLKPQK